MGAKRGTPTERFWRHVNKTDTCWLWTGADNGRGYGLFGLDTKRSVGVLAHRFSWQLHNGPIPIGLYVCHHCDVKRCIRPSHLFIGTATDNMRDCNAKGRINYAKGTQKSGAKLTPEAVAEIRRDYRPYRVPAGVFARKFGVSEQSIRVVVRGLAWRHV